MERAVADGILPRNHVFFQQVRNFSSAHSCELIVVAVDSETLNTLLDMGWALRPGTSGARAHALCDVKHRGGLPCARSLSGREQPDACNGGNAGARSWSAKTMHRHCRYRARKTQRNAHVTNNGISLWGRIPHRSISAGVRRRRQRARTTSTHQHHHQGMFSHAFDAIFDKNRFGERPFPSARACERRAVARGHDLCQLNMSAGPSANQVVRKHDGDAVARGGASSPAPPEVMRA